MKLRVLLTIVLTWFAVTGGVFAVTSFEDANRFFAAGDFAKAAESYQNLIDENGASAALYYNLGNSEYRLGHFGPAILAYERAKLLAPRDPDLIANLNLAKKAATVFDKGRFDPRIEAVLNWLSLNEWSRVVVAAVLWIGLFSLMFGLVKGGNKITRRLAAGSMIFAGLLIILGATVLVLRRDEGARGIVLTKDAAVHLSPFEKAESIGTPGAGRIVQMGAQSGGYIYVDVPSTGLHGWMNGKEVEKIVK